MLDRLLEGEVPELLVPRPFGGYTAEADALPGTLGEARDAMAHSLGGTPARREAMRRCALLDVAIYGRPAVDATPATRRARRVRDERYWVEEA